MAKSYIRLRPIRTEIERDPNRGILYESEAKRWHAYASITLYNPPYDTLIPTLQDAIKVLEKQDEGEIDHDEAIYQLKSLQDTYAERTRDFMMQFSHIPLDILKTTLHNSGKFFVYAGTAINFLGSSTSPLTAGKYGKVEDLMRDLTDSTFNHGVHPSVRRYVFNQSVGSCGLTFAGRIRFPYFITLIPGSLQTDLAGLAITERQLYSDSEDFESVSDETQESMERDYFYDVQTRGLAPPDPNGDEASPHTSRSRGRSTHPRSSTSAPASDDHTSGGTGGNSQTSPSTSEGNDNASGSRASDNDTNVPDDTNYIPDVIMSDKARPFTRVIQARTTVDDLHDHMTRFSTNSEAPASISKFGLRPTDWTIQVRDRNGIRNYLVTYTRKSKKPIFSQY
jgi:hypothetical protein